VFRSVVVLIGVATLVLLCGPGCGDVDHPESGPNAPCTRSKDCRHELRCVDGVCLDPDAPPPSEVARDAGADA